MKKFAVLSALGFAALLSATVVDDINNMPDNSWLKLPDNGSKPIVRSSSPVMHYDGDSVAYLWGCSHAKHNNDLWAFNLSANRWREALPTEVSAMVDPLVIKNKDSILMTRAERPLSAHQWSGMDFDTDQKRLWWNPHIAWQGLYSGHDSVICQYQPGPACQAHTPYQVFWYYDTPTNKWHYVNSRSNSSLISYYGGKTKVFRYLPFIKKFILLNYNYNTYYNGKFLFLDPATERLEEIAGTRTPIQGDPVGSGNYDGTCAGAVYDTQNDLLVYLGRNGGTWTFDPKTMAFNQIITEAKSPPVWSDCPMSYMVYDPGDQKVLVFVTTGGQGCYSTGTSYASRGWPSTGTHVYALDLANKQWNLLPNPTAGDNANTINGDMGHSYFDKKLGVIFHFSGTYDAANGERWVYKYKQGAGTGEEGRGQRAEGKGKILLSSNPVRGTVAIQTRAGSFAIYNLKGSRVAQFQGNRGVWNPAGFPNGLYLVQAPRARAVKLILER